MTVGVNLYSEPQNISRNLVAMLAPKVRGTVPIWEVSAKAIRYWRTDFTTGTASLRMLMALNIGSRVL